MLVEEAAYSVLTNMSERSGELITEDLKTPNNGNINIWSMSPSFF